MTNQKVSRWLSGIQNNIEIALSELAMHGYSEEVRLKLDDAVQMVKNTRGELADYLPPAPSIPRMGGSETVPVNPPPSIRPVLKVNLRVKGTHSWPMAPADNNFASLLAVEHRHIFTLALTLHPVSYDRSVEFFEAQLWLLRLINTSYPRNVSTDLHIFGYRSCETIAKEIYKHAMEEGLPVTKVEVWEDDENMGGVERV